MKTYAVYILASRMRGTLYIGVTGDLVRRVYEHRHNTGSRFTHRYRVQRLVYFELHDAPRPAIAREKRLKHWSRARKIVLVEATNPQWRDLYPEI